MPNTEQTDIKIEEAIVSGEIEELCKKEEISAEQIKKFVSTKLKMGAFLYACHYAKFETVKFITDYMIKYFDDIKGKNTAEDEDEDEYSTFFYEMGYEDIKGKRYSAPIILLHRNEDGCKIFQYTNQFLDFFEKEELLKEIATPRGSSFQGYTKDEPTCRSFRAFSGERERQLLKQFSTILFFEIRENLENKADLIEVQTMHLRIGDSSYLFVAGNKSCITNQFSEKIKNFNDLKKVLVNKNRSITEDLEGKIRVERYADKFSKLIYGESSYKVNNDYTEKADLERFEQIKSLLLNQDVVIKDLKLNYSKNSIKDNSDSSNPIKEILNSNKTANIVFVNTSCCEFKYEKRHAEEFLVDIAEVAVKIAEEKNKTFHACIGGKKRPCTTCFGRMKNFNTSHNDSSKQIKFG